MHGKATGILAGLICAGAGIYLLSHNTQAGNSVFDLLAHGIGAYFIGKAIFIAGSMWAQDDQVKLLERIADQTDQARSGRRPEREPPAATEPRP